MAYGVTFQPGQSFEQERERRMAERGTADGVQEAIRVLSLRLPKVVGAHAPAPSALLQSQGSSGSRDVDSMVEGVLQRIFPNARPASASSAPPAPMMPVERGPDSSPPQHYAQPTTPNWLSDFNGTRPRMVFGSPFGDGDFMFGQDGRPMNPPGLPGVGGGNPFPPATIAPLPSAIPDLRRQLDWVPAPDAGRAYEI